MYVSSTTHLRIFCQVANVGNFEGGVHFEPRPRISGDTDIWHLDVPQGLTRPCNGEAGPERYLCVNCSLVRNEDKKPGRCSYMVLPGKWILTISF
jgi:hypothetical protein